MTISEKIYEMRSSRNMSLREFAKLTGLTHTTIARLESPTLGPQKIFLDTVYQICKKLNYNFVSFLFETRYITDYEIQTATAPMGDALTEKESALLEAFRQLLPESQDFILRGIQSFGNKKSVT